MTRSLAELLPEAIRRAMHEEIDTCLSARVDAYDVSSQTVTVTPFLARRYRDPDGNVQYLELPTLSGIPVAFPTTAEFGLTWPLRRGDRGYLLIRSGSHDEVDTGDQEPPVQPQSSRRFDQSDAIFLPSHPLPGDPLQPKDVSDTDMTVRLPAGAKLKVGSAVASKALALAEECATQLRRIENHLNTVIYTVASGASVPAVPPPFGPLSAPPQPFTTTADLASTQIDVES